jgi:hypothetical protein
MGRGRGGDWEEREGRVQKGSGGGLAAPVNELRGDLVADEVKMVALRRERKSYTQNTPMKGRVCGVGGGVARVQLWRIVERAARWGMNGKRVHRNHNNQDEGLRRSKGMRRMMGRGRRRGRRRRGLVGADLRILKPNRVFAMKLNLAGM